jgi:cold shock CspA family protein
MTERETGRIIRYLEDKKYGFINYGSNKDVFFHQSEITDSRISEAINLQGMKVSFTVGVGGDGRPVAKDICLAD